MKKIIKKNNKRAFTLVEMMLAIAIIMITLDAFYGLILMSYQAHLKVFNTNDATDYAMLNARALENVLIQAKTFGRDGGSHQLASNGSIITLDGTPLFNMQQLTYANGVSKWRVDLEFFSSPNNERGTINYQITIIDNYYNPGNVCATYSSMVWVPHSESLLGITDTYGGLNFLTFDYYT